MPRKYAHDARKSLPKRLSSAIQSGMVINALQQHVLNGAEMSSTQITAARILLAKTVPDLSPTTEADSREPDNPHEFTADDLSRIIEGEASRKPEHNQALMGPPVEGGVGGSMAGGVGDEHEPAPSRNSRNSITQKGITGRIPLDPDRRQYTEDAPVEMHTATDGVATMFRDFDNAVAKTRREATKRAPLPPCPEGYRYGDVSDRGNSVKLIKVDEDGNDVV